MGRADQLSGASGVLGESDADDVLLERHRRGDPAAFEQLVVRYHRVVYNAAYWVVRRGEDAADVTQIVFLKVLERLDDYDPQYRFFSWLYRLAVNESLNLLRRNGRDEPLADDFDAEAPASAAPEHRLQAAQDARRLKAALMKMSTTDRTVLTLRHFAECSYDEIAHILGIDAKTVKSRLFDARGRLRGLLESR